MDASVEPGPPLATLGQRILAQVVDAFPAFGIFMLVGLTLAPRFGGATATGFQLEGAPALLVMTVVTALLLAYFTLCETLFGATLGKVATGIRVRSPGGGRVGLRAALLRNILRAVDGLALYLVGALLIVVTRRRQRLGDLAARSIVVRHPTPRWARVAAGVVAMALAVGGAVAGYRMRGPVGPGAWKTPGQPIGLVSLMLPPSDMKGGEGCSTRPGLVQVAAVACRHQHDTGESQPGARVPRGG